MNGNGDHPKYWTQLPTEQFGPRQLVQHAQAAERAGFDGLNLSDHFQPWWEPGHSPHAWVVLGAIGEQTDRVPIGTGVTAPVFRHNPAVVAQAFATLEAMNPERTFVGIGSGESLNESPCGMDWPSVGEQIGRMDEALEIIDGLLDGERVDHDGRYFKAKDAYLHTQGERRPPVFVSAFGPQAAEVAARRGDGVWTLADPEQASEVIDAYRGACEDAGKEPGQIILQAGFSWAESDEQALEGSRVWKGALPPEHFTENWPDPEQIRRNGEKQISDEEFCSSYIVSADPDEHVDRVREIEALGPTVVCLQNVSGADPVRAFGVYGDRVLPALRSGRG